MDPPPLDLALLVGLSVFLVAVVAVRVSARTGLPSLLVYLAIGLAIGEAGLGIRFDDFALVQELGLLALAVILAEGGTSTRLATVRPVLPVALVLATAGVGISVAVVAAGAHYVVGLDATTSILLGAAVSSTDAAAVFAVLRTFPLRPRLRATVEAESGFNDPPVVILVTLVTSPGWAEATLLGALGGFAYQLLLGAAVGLAVGWAGHQLLARVSLPAAGLYPLAALAVTLLAYALATVLQSSGFVAVYLAGIWLGNTAWPHRRAALGFIEGMGWVAQIGLFILLGLLASPERLPAEALAALVVGAVLTFVARPLSVLACTLPFRMSWREQVFLSWAGLRGAVPIVLATIGTTSSVVGSSEVFDIVFLLVVAYTLLQGPTLPWLARRLGLGVTDAVTSVGVDSAPLGQADADLLAVFVPPGSRLHGVHLADLRLPPGAFVAGIVREGRTMAPDPIARLRRGDQVMVVTTTQAREATERRLREVARAGRLGRWRDGT